MRAAVAWAAGLMLLAGVLAWSHWWWAALPVALVAVLAQSSTALLLFGVWLMTISPLFGVPALVFAWFWWAQQPRGRRRW
jgi:Zn-dependent protease with chaperone function